MDHGLNGPPLVERDKEQEKGSQALKQNKPQVVMVFHKHALLILMLKREQRCVSLFASFLQKADTHEIVLKTSY